MPHWSSVAALLPPWAWVLVAGFLVLSAVRVMRRFARRRPASAEAGSAEASPTDIITPRAATADSLTNALAGQLPYSSEQQAGLQRDLLRAGEFHPAAARRFHATRNVYVLLLVAAAGGLVLLSGPEDREFGLAAGGVFLFLAMATFVALRLFVRHAGNCRVARIERGLPDLLDLTAMCIASGMPLRDSLWRVEGDLRHAHPDLASELAVTRRHAELGTLEQAFTAFAARTDSADARSLAHLVRDTAKRGTPIDIMVRGQATNLRQTFHQQAEERANRSLVKVILPFVLCILPAAMIFMWAPAFMQFREMLARESRPGGALQQNASSLVREAQRDFEQRSSPSAQQTDRPRQSDRAANGPRVNPPNNRSNANRSPQDRSSGLRSLRDR